MTNPITALTELAAACYESTVEGNSPNQAFTLATASGDPIRDGLMRFSSFGPGRDAELERVGQAVASEADLKFLLSPPSELGFMVMRPGSGGRTNLKGIVAGLLTSAAMRLHVLRLQPSKSAFVGLVLENYEELRRAARGEQVRAYRIIGFSGPKLQEDDRVTTPWGTLYPAPDFGPSLVLRPFMPTTTVILVTPQLLSLTISTEAGPILPPPDQEWLAQSEKISRLVSLAFALATIDGKLCAPLTTFQSAIYPFGPLGFSGIYSFSPMVSVTEPTSSELVQAEVWTRRLDQHYIENLQIAGRRIVSAIAQRQDRSDALIDAVTAWESMVGTGTEVSFRVTAALAKLLEPDPRKRLDFRKELGRIYALRSRVVHGDPVEASEVSSAADRAIDIGLRTFSALYARSEDWLTAKSEERANLLILEE